MEKLTESQYNILQVLKKLIAERGFPPTVREIGEAAHLSSPATTHFHLNKLAEKGYIEKGNGKNRTAHGTFRRIFQQAWERQVAQIRHHCRDSRDSAAFPEHGDTRGRRAAAAGQLRRGRRPRRAGA